MARAYSMTGPRHVRPLIIDGGFARVALTRGLEALIDCADAERIGQHPWSAMRTSNGKIYAKRNRLISDGPGASVILMHRVIAGAPAGAEIDHVNGDGTDNRRQNLRVATHRQNMQNTSLRSDNTSGLKGAFWDKSTNRWMAAIGHDGRFINLGRYNTAEEAHEAYAAAARRLFGEFARLT